MNKWTVALLVAFALAVVAGIVFLNEISKIS